MNLHQHLIIFGNRFFYLLEMKNIRSPYWVYTIAFTNIPPTCVDFVR